AWASPTPSGRPEVAIPGPGLRHRPIEMRSYLDARARDACNAPTARLGSGADRTGRWRRRPTPDADWTGRWRRRPTPGVDEAADARAPRQAIRRRGGGGGDLCSHLDAVIEQARGKVKAFQAEAARQEACERFQ